MVTVGLIAEGITDQIILEHFIEKIAGDSGVLPTELQPKLDPNDRGQQLTPGNFDQVLKYCASESFSKAIKSSPALHIVIQIDSDVFDSGQVSEKYRFAFNKENGERISTGEIIHEISTVLIHAIGEELYEDNHERIHFAIPVNESECWLLPYFYNEVKKSNKVSGCIAAINKAISGNKKYGFSIAGKHPDYYRELCKSITKDKKFEQTYKKNESLEVFVNSIKNINFEEE